MLTYVYRPIYCFCLFIAATVFPGEQRLSKARRAADALLISTIELVNSYEDRGNTFDKPH